jgi:hypothetical protein
VLFRSIMSSLDIEETFLTVTTPSGRHYRIGRDQFHIHHRGVNGLLGSELHLNLPDNSALEIWADFHREGVPAVSYAQEPAVSYAQEMARMQRQRMERERWQSGQPL